MTERSALSLWRRANFNFAGEPSAESDRACASKRSRCGTVQIFNFAGEPCAEIMRVETLWLWHRANFQRGLRTFSLFSAGARAGTWSVLRNHAFRNRRPSRCFWRMVVRGASSQFCLQSTTVSRTLAHGASREFCLESTTVSLFSAGGSAGA